MLLKDGLMQYRRIDLLHIAKLKGFRGAYRYRKEELAEALAEYMLKPEIIERYFMWLQDDEIENFRENPPELICQSEYAIWMGCDTFVVPDDVLEAYERINTPEFHQKRKIWVQLSRNFGQEMNEDGEEN